MGSAVTIFGCSVLALLLAGYFGQRFLPPPKAKLVGLDLGTTFSCLGVYQAGTGQVQVLGDASGHSCIPSVVAFTKTGEVLVGHQAMAQAESNPSNTLYDAKRFIGKVFSKKQLAEEAARYPFKVLRNEEGMARFVVGPPTNQSVLSPEQVGAYVLRALRDTAERQLGLKVKAAVMSVPAEFNAQQRNHTVKAAELAGMEVWRLISEPTAAALACGLHKEEGQGTVMVVDLGGGTLDVSLLLRQGGMFLTQAMAGNNHLGGQDLNQRLFGELRRRVEEAWHLHVSGREDLQTLRLLTEQLKLTLSAKEQHQVDFRSHELQDEKGRPRTIQLQMSRTDLESLCADLLARVLDPIKAVLDFAELAPRDVDHVVLVGGSTRVPKVRQLVQEFFGKPPLTNVNPDEAVAIGTGIQAGILGDMWPVTVSATEVPTSVSKIQVT